MTERDLLCLAMGLWMLGVSVAHLLRFLVFDDSRMRQFVAASGVTIYAAAAAFAFAGMLKAAWWIAVVFPMIGVASTIVAAKTGSADDSERSIKGSPIDEWQLAVGVTQFHASVFSVIGLIFFG